MFAYYDKLVKQHHIDEAIAKYAKRKQEPKLDRGIGLIVKGSVHDCNRASFQRKLTDYWHRLFVGWNPYKLNGRGCWEVWQMPEKKQKLNDMEHWIADLETLSYDFITKLRDMDSWENSQFWKDADEEQAELEAKYERQEDESISYAIRHNKSLFRRLKGLAQDGYNPLWFFSDKRQGNGEV